MKRFGQLVTAIVLVAGWGAAPLYAQSTEAKWSGQVDGAATLGHSSSASFGGEIDYRWDDSWDISFEAGHIGNITSADLQTRATDFVNAAATLGYFAQGTTANPVQHAIYYDIGFRYRLMPDGTWNPYLAVGFGGARVNTETGFSSPPSIDIPLGLDLDGYVTKAFLMFGAGVNHPLSDRYFVDGSVRLGRVLARTGAIEGDKGVNTLRLQVGLGIRF